MVLLILCLKASCRQGDLPSLQVSAPLVASIFDRRHEHLSVMPSKKNTSSAAEIGFGHRRQDITMIPGILAWVGVQTNIELCISLFYEGLRLR